MYLQPIGFLSKLIKYEKKCFKAIDVRARRVISDPNYLPDIVTGNLESYKRSDSLDLTTYYIKIKNQIK